jgi:mycoredoxin-dependent peroxiredoxin
MRKLFLVIPVSATLLAGTTWYRLTRPPASAAPAVVATEVRPAPLFQLEDEQSQIVRLTSFVGRHKLLIVFFDGTEGPDRSRLLGTLRDNFQTIAGTKARIFAISDLRPSELRPPNDARGERTRRPVPFPFPMLSDIRDHEWHRRYGAFDEETGAPREAVFVVDRAGVIRHAHLGPDQLGTPETWARELHGVR